MEVAVPGQTRTSKATPCAALLEQLAESEANAFFSNDAQSFDWGQLGIDDCVTSTVGVDSTDGATVNLRNLQCSTDQCHCPADECKAWWCQLQAAVGKAKRTHEELTQQHTDVHTKRRRLEQELKLVDNTRLALETNMQLVKNHMEVNQSLQQTIGKLTAN